VTPGLLSWAFAAGSVAALNPCGFAVLPAYLAYQLGRDGHTPVGPTVLRGAARGLVMTGGIMSLFALLGWTIGAIRAALLPVVPWLAVAVGAILIVLGGVLLLRRRASVELPVAGLAARIRPAGRTWLAAYLFGVGYGLASLGCTLPIFLAITAQTLATRSLWQALGVVVAYGAGMGWILMVATVAVAAGNAVVLRLLRSVMGLVQSAGAVAMIAAGGYLIWYYRAAW
jgi:cytochrome c-type biogenesis protein